MWFQRCDIKTLGGHRLALIDRLCCGRREHPREDQTVCVEKEHNDESHDIKLSSPNNSLTHRFRRVSSCLANVFVSTLSKGFICSPGVYAPPKNEHGLSRPQTAYHVNQLIIRRMRGQTAKLIGRLMVMSYGNPYWEQVIFAVDLFMKLSLEKKCGGIRGTH